MRGKGIKQRDSRVAMGITPAYAGKRLVWQIKVSTRWDHPRVCGEKENGATVDYPLLGSPPRMRGKEIAPLTGRILLGITPAYAGKRHTKV